MKSDILGAFA